MNYFYLQILITILVKLIILVIIKYLKSNTVVSFIKLKKSF